MILRSQEKHRITAGNNEAICELNNSNFHSQTTYLTGSSLI